MTWQECWAISAAPCPAQCTQAEATKGIADGRRVDDAARAEAAAQLGVRRTCRLGGVAHVGCQVEAHAAPQLLGPSLGELISVRSRGGHVANFNRRGVCPAAQADCSDRARSVDRKQGHNSPPAASLEYQV
jgi:hypothetical protein